MHFGTKWPHYKDCGSHPEPFVGIRVRMLYIKPARRNAEDARVFLAVAERTDLQEVHAMGRCQLTLYDLPGDLLTPTQEHTLMRERMCAAT